MSILSIARWIETTALAQAISQSAWMFPAAETIHVIAIALVVGSIAMLDLRLLGVSWTRRPITEIATEVLPWTWISFGIAAVAGAVMFTSAAEKYITDLPFQLKFVLMFLAGVNMAAFHHFTYRNVAQWDQGVSPPRAAKIAAALSLVFWVGVVTCGRLVSFSIENQFGPVSAADPSAHTYSLSVGSNSG